MGNEKDSDSGFRIPVGLKLLFPKNDIPEGWVEDEVQDHEFGDVVICTKIA